MRRWYGSFRFVFCHCSISLLLLLLLPLPLPLPLFYCQYPSMTCSHHHHCYYCTPPPTYPHPAQRNSSTSASPPHLPTYSIVRSRDMPWADIPEKKNPPIPIPTTNIQVTIVLTHIGRQYTHTYIHTYLGTSAGTHVEKLFNCPPPIQHMSPFSAF